MPKELNKRTKPHLAEIARINDEISDLEYERREAVRLARVNGASWTDIGISLGVSRQAAWERFKKSSETPRHASA